MSISQRFQGVQVFPFILDDQDDQLYAKMSLKPCPFDIMTYQTVLTHIITNHHSGFSM